MLPLHCLLVYIVSGGKSAVILMSICLCVMCPFSLAAFKIFSFDLILGSLAVMCLCVCCGGWGALYPVVILELLGSVVCCHS